MKYQLLKDVLVLLEDFENSDVLESNDLEGFKKWLISNHIQEVKNYDKITWEGKDKGRSMDSVINTLLVHMNNYAKIYSKAAIIDSEFSTQEDFIYLINLRAFGKMSKIDLIKKNVHFKPGGMLIINRLLAKGWIGQESFNDDKRVKKIFITDLGLKILESQMGKIRQATNLVTGELSDVEKMELINLLNKLDSFHREVYDKNIHLNDLLKEAALYKVR